jgi:hypothetical protein
MMIVSEQQLPVNFPMKDAGFRIGVAACGLNPAANQRLFVESLHISIVEDWP